MNLLLIVRQLYLHWITGFAKITVYFGIWRCIPGTVCSDVSSSDVAFRRVGVSTRCWPTLTLKCLGRNFDLCANFQEKNLTLANGPSASGGSPDLTS